MQLKRYEGKTLRGTLERVKQELGPDALIVSSRTPSGWWMPITDSSTANGSVLHPA